jgi:hypothetical protein
MQMPQLPHFIIIGAGKSGTTSLHEYLRQNPNISLPRRKETHFFICDKESVSIPQNYQGRVLEDVIDNLDDYLNEFESKPGVKIYGEVCPTYLFYPNASLNIHKYVPDVKIICVLRNPIDRFYSNFNFWKKKNDSTEFDTIVSSITEHSSDMDINRFLEVGFYYKLLSRYYETFPSTNIKVFLFEDLQKQPKKLMDDLMAFIGLPEYPFDLDMKFNTSGKLNFRITYKFIRKSKVTKFLRKLLSAKTYQKYRAFAERIIIQQADPISSKSRKTLQNIYRQDILDLQKLIKRDLSEWLA